MTLAYTVNQKDVLAVKCQSSPAEPLLEPFEHNSVEPTQTHQKTIPAHAGTHFNPWVTV